MKIRYHFNTLPLLVLLGTAAAADAQVQPQLAQRWFEEATKLCERDAGRLWGVSLCGPMVIFDQATGTRATSQPEPEGPPPRFPGFADGPVSWGGLRWFSLPLYMLADKDADVRQQIMLHGLFHRIQPELGFMHEQRLQRASRYARRARLDAARMAGAPPGARVERERPGRGDRRCAGLQTRAPPPVSRRGGQRTARRDSEGLASYTGVAAWANSPADAHRAAAQLLQEANRSRPSSERSPTRRDPPTVCCWTISCRDGAGRFVATSDLGDLLASATNRPLTTDLAVAAARYDGATLRTAEEARDRARQVRVAELRRRFVDGPVLTMPAAGSGTSDSTGAVGIPGAGTVFFRNFTLSAQWGRLNANGGVLRAADGATLSVPVTGPLEGTTLQGDGWSATLNSGWVVRPAARPGSFTIVREK